MRITFLRCKPPLLVNFCWFWGITLSFKKVCLMKQRNMNAELLCACMQLAMRRVQMCNAVKVLLAFSKPFWPDSFFDVICTGELNC